MSLFNSLHNIYNQKKTLETQIAKSRDFNKLIIDKETITKLDKINISKNNQGSTHSSMITNLLKTTKHNLPNQKNLTGFVLSIINNVKYAWMKAKKDYSESQKKRTNLRPVRKKTNSYLLRPKKTTMKMQRHSPIPKIKNKLIIKNPIQDTSETSTQLTTFQSNEELSPTDLREFHKPYTPSKMVNMSDSKDPEIMVNSINQASEIEIKKSIKTETMNSSIISLEEELKKTKKRLEMFEQKYGLFENLFINSEDKEILETPITSFKTQNHSMSDTTHRLSPIFKNTEKSEEMDKSHTLTESHEHVFINEDPSLETLSPIILQNKNYSYNPNMI